MGKKSKQKLRERSDSEESSEWENEAHQPIDVDSDSELQEAFAAGHLKQGLNFAVEGRRPLANNKERLAQKLEEIRLDLPWIERLDLTSRLAPLGPEMAAEIGMDPNMVVHSKKTKRKIPSGEEDDDDELDELDNVDNDFVRELRFYRQAQGAVLEALPRLKALGIPTKRPEDYFAEMAKSDGHMKKVREKLISKQTSMELSEKAKKLREQRKYGKQVQVEVMKKRLEEKKKLAESVKKFRKGGRGEQDELDFLTELEGGEKKNQRNGQAQKNGPMKKSGKQKFKDSKYGFGGQKKRSKYNTKDSADDVANRFDRKKHGSAPAKGRSKGAAQKRPGNIARKKMKNKNKR